MPKEEAEIIGNRVLKGLYREMRFAAPLAAAEALPGQFVHIQVAMRDRLLRRPFSIRDAANGELSVVYKVVGEGTRRMAELAEGTRLDMMGPLGKPYSLPGPEDFPVIVAGGYGLAATYLLAVRSPRKGALLVGARTADDLILLDAFEKLGFSIEISTDSGEVGRRGVVTDLMAPYIQRAKKDPSVRFYGCGPNAMTRAMAERLLKEGLNAELSIDRPMGCGVGACYACVVKARAPERPSGWRYARTCKEGPVFMADMLYFDSGDR